MVKKSQVLQKYSQTQLIYTSAILVIWLHSTTGMSHITLCGNVSQL